MNIGKFASAFIVYSFCLTVSAYSQNRYSFSIKIGILGQFYIKEEYNDKRQGVQQDNGPSGRPATIGLGLPADLGYQRKFFLLLFTPVIRYAKLYGPSANNFSEKWGITVDAHLSAGWQFDKKRGPLKKTLLGIGFGLYNIGQPFDTYYSWSPNINFIPKNEFQATTLQFWAIHGLYERQAKQTVFCQVDGFVYSETMDKMDT